MKFIIDIIILFQLLPLLPLLPLLILLIQLILFTCLFIKIIMGSPIFFIKEISVLNRKLFKIIKFRTIHFTNTSFININLDI